MLIRDGLGIATGRHQAIKDRLTTLFEPAIEAVTELCQVSVEMFAGDMTVGASNPALQAGNDAVDIG